VKGYITQSSKYTRMYGLRSGVHICFYAFKQIAFLLLRRNNIVSYRVAKEMDSMIRVLMPIKMVV
jgi:hypothetical protein